MYSEKYANAIVMINPDTVRLTDDPPKSGMNLKDTKFME